MRTAEQRTPMPRALACGALLAGSSVGLSAGVALLASAPVRAVHARLGAGTSWSALPLDLLVQALAAAALLCCTAWLAVVVVVSVGEALVESAAGVCLGAARAITPAVVRRAVTLCCGVAVGGSTLTGTAWAVPAGPEPEVGDASAPATRYVPTPPVDAVLSGLPLPDRAAGAAPVTALPAGSRRSTRRQPQVAPASATTVSHHALVPASHRHRVHPGESLWAIAAEHLPRAGSARLDSAWRALYRANRRAVGPDPDLLIPGTTLRLPPGVRPERPDRPGSPGAADHRKDPS